MVGKLRSEVNTTPDLVACQGPFASRKEGSWYDACPRVGQQNSALLVSAPNLHATSSGFGGIGI